MQLVKKKSSQTWEIDNLQPHLFFYFDWLKREQIKKERMGYYIRIRTTASPAADIEISVPIQYFITSYFDASSWAFSEWISCIDKPTIKFFSFLEPVLIQTCIGSIKVISLSLSDMFDCSRYSYGLISTRLKQFMAVRPD